MDTDIIIIGAGIVGISISKYLISKGYSVILIEKEENYGQGISSRSSEVIHAGIYYHTDSLKASLCLRGRQLLYEYCPKKRIPHKKIGKLIIATDKSSVDRLDKIYKQAEINGLNTIKYLDKKYINKIEPNLKCEAALLSPETGIIDSYKLMRSLINEARSKGTIFISGTSVEGGHPASNGWNIYVKGKESTTLTTKLVVNAAGLYAIELSKKIFPELNLPTLHPLKGNFIKYMGASPVKHIIYPALIPGVVEERVDATPTLDNSLRFGPDTEKVESLDDFSISKSTVDKMMPSIIKYLPDIDTSLLFPDFSGIRPRIYASTDHVKDYVFDWSPDARWLNLFGMESPALTSCLAIAEYIQKDISERKIL